MAAAIDNRLHVYYVTVPAERHESGVDNPFRPDGELSREADTIVSLIKEGKPITTLKSSAEGAPDATDAMVANGLHDPTDPRLLTGPANGQREVREVVIGAPRNEKGANGSTKPPAPGVVEVQHGVIVPPSDAPAVEQVVIKKKPKCKCCVIQ